MAKKRPGRAPSRPNRKPLPMAGAEACLSARLPVHVGISVSGMRIASGLDRENRYYEVLAAIAGDKTVYLVRDGLPTRAVSLGNLVMAMIDAE